MQNKYFINGVIYNEYVQTILDIFKSMNNITKIKICLESNSNSFVYPKKFKLENIKCKFFNTVLKTKATIIGNIIILIITSMILVKF